jgi:hypothetical protein
VHISVLEGRVKRIHVSPGTSVLIVAVRKLPPSEGLALISG